MFECFDLNVDKGTVHIVAQIDDFEGPLQCSPMKRRCHASVRNRIPTIERATNVRGKSTSKKKTTTNDSVGVDEEGMYSETDSLVAASDSSYDIDLAASSDSNDEGSDPEFDPDGEIGDVDDEFHPPPFSYDVDAPCIDVDAVNLEQKTCTCRAWQVTGKPCSHALSFLAKLSRKVQMDEFVHEYFSVDRFKKTYACTFNPMTSKDS